MTVLAIIPVKSFPNAKSRLDIPTESRKTICAIMLEFVLEAVVKSNITHTLVITKDEKAMDIATRFKASVITDDAETGVNDALVLANAKTKEYDSSLVLPQDIPLVEPSDINTALDIAPVPGALVVPSRKLDGTNALVRTPANAFATHYDEDSYRVHMSTARNAKMCATLGFIRNVMIDIDTRNDLDFVINNSTRPELSKKLGSVLCS